MTTSRGYLSRLLQNCGSGRPFATVWMHSAIEFESARHLASQGIYGGGKRPFGFDAIDGR
jgi:hypothetical protein